MTNDSPIAILVRRGMSQTSWIKAVQDFNTITDGWTKHDYERLIEELLLEPVTFEDERTARISAGYLVQELMRVFVNRPDQILDVEAVWVDAQQRTAAYIERINSGDLMFMQAKPETDDYNENAEPVVDDRGNRKRKKGAKKQMAAEMYRDNRETKTRAEIIEMFMTDIGMSKAGATTYFHNNKAEFGPCKEN